MSLGDLHIHGAHELLPHAEAVLCRERQEKAAAKARAAAEAHWRNLLRSIFTRLHVQGQYATADAAATPEIGRSPAPAQREHTIIPAAASLIYSVQLVRIVHQGAALDLARLGARGRRSCCGDAVAEVP